MFTSIEALDHARSLVVRDGADCLTPFLRDRLFVSILKNCRHRPGALTNAGMLTAAAIPRLCALQREGVISTKDIAETALEILRNYDAAAAVQYEAYHRASLSAT
jgi:transcriptional regulator NrdR family protein